MSRYVRHKHGLTIGSGNIFFVIDCDPDEEGAPSFVLPEGVDRIRDGYTAILTFHSYTFDQCDSLNVFIETPASQLMWKCERISWETPYKTKSGEIIMLPHSFTTYLLQSWAKKWLNENVGPCYEYWDTYTRGSRGCRNGRCLFFKRRKDALAVARMIDTRLAGIKFSKYG